MQEKNLPDVVVPKHIWDALIENDKKYQQLLEEKKQQLLMAKDLAESANRTKSEFLTNMSHEIRTPMNAVLGFTQILETQVTDKKHREYLSIIHSAGKTLLAIIDDILDLSKIEAGKMELVYSPVNIRSVFKDVEKMFKENIEKKGLELIVEFGSNLPQYLLIDEKRLRQILINLVGNAVKFTSRGYIKIRADVKSPSYENSDNNIVNFIFSVEDTGIGIMKNEREAVFEAFEQQEKKRNYTHGGTGLGLAISRRLVEMMGGSVSLSGEKGAGSRFDIEIKEAVIAQEPETVQKTKAQESEIKDFNFFSKIKALIADDDEDNRKVLTEYLEMYNFECIEADNGKSAIELAEKYIPDVILMDLKMPVMDGDEALEIIKSDTKTSGIPVLAVTAMILNEKEQEKMKSFDGYLIKPVAIKEVINELRNVLDKKIKKKKNIFPNHDDKILYSESILIKPEEVQELITNLEYESKKWEYLYRTFPINEIQDFGRKMEEIGEKYFYKELTGWARNIQNQADIFDMDSLRITLSKFPEIIKQVKNKGSDLINHP